MASGVGVVGATPRQYHTTLDDVVTTSLPSPREAAHAADQTGHSLLTTTTLNRPAAMVAGETWHTRTQPPQLLCRRDRAAVKP
jgi:hypothetical protein